MKTPDFDRKRFRQLIAETLDGQLDEPGRLTLNQVLESSAEARREYRELMELHARLHLEYTGGREAEFMPGSPHDGHERPRPIRPMRWLAAAAAIALLAVFSWRGAVGPKAFATLETAHSARWGSGDLPTREGSRLGAGRLRIEEGLAVIRFDSGAELSLEAPAELTIVDAMNCRVTDGTAVANVPESAIGFRIATPSATLIDHGTRFAVSVDAESGGTRTQVFEGLVDVENPSTGEVVSLRTGQRASVQGRQTGPVTDGFEERFQSKQPEPMPAGPDWMLFKTYKDAYIGYLLDTDSELLLYIKHGNPGFHRKAYLGFDLSTLEPAKIASARLMLQFEPTGLGLASHVPDSTFAVYGIAKGDLPWDEDTLRPYNAPANIEETGDGLVPAEVRKLGSFIVKQGVQHGRFGIEGDTLSEYLREHAGSTVTLIIVRETAETGETGLVHGIASSRHPKLPAPTLAIRLRED
jgi:hypothetical protein